MKKTVLLLAFSCAALGNDLWRAVSLEDPVKIKDAFKRLTDFSVTNEAGLTLLGHAVHIRNVYVVQTLLDRMRELFDMDTLRLYVNPIDETDTHSALYLAVVLNRPEILRALLRAGAEVNYVFNVGMGDFRLRDLFGGRHSPEIEAIFNEYNATRLRSELAVLQQQQQVPEPLYVPPHRRALYGLQQQQTTSWYGWYRLYGASAAPQVQLMK